MRTKKLLAMLLCLATVICSVQFTAFAADPSVVEIDGQRFAFFSSFGKINYNGKSYAAFKTYEDAAKALGSEGGSLAFNGKITISEFADNASRGEINFVGTGTKATQNIINLSGNQDINFLAPVTFDFLCISNDEGAYFLTNGNSFKLCSAYEAFVKEVYVMSEGRAVKEYPNQPSVAPGKVDGKADKIEIFAGKLINVAAGSARGAAVNGDTFIEIKGGEIENAIAGNAENGTMTGNANVTVSAGTVKKLVAGSSAGTFNGNSFTTVARGNKTIDEIVIGAESGATINGGVVIRFEESYNTKFTAGTGTVTGKKIVVMPNGVTVDVPANVADYVITTDDATVTPKDGKVLVADLFGNPATNILVNGSEMSSGNGVYDLPAGKLTISVPSAVKIALNPSAKYVAGYEDGTFRPQNNMTKAEAITLLTRTIVDETKIKTIKADYPSVAADAWYSPYIGLFQHLGYLGLLENGTDFNPDEKITRGEFTQLIYEISSLKVNAENTNNETGKSTKLIAVVDVPGTNEFYPAVSYAMSNGVVTGYEDGTFRPDGNITRAEVVTMVNRFLGRAPTGGAAGTFADVSGHWAEPQVVAACGEQGTAWTPAVKGGKYVLTGTNAKEYVYGLYDQSKTLSGDAIIEGIDVISEQLKKDILSAPNTKDLYPERFTKKTYYISEKNGNDENDGLSEATPFKTIAGFTAKKRFMQKGDAVLFERGGVYRGTLSVNGGITIGSYGTGEKPVLMQSKKNYADPSLWVETEWENVWKCTDSLLNVGVIAFDHDIYDHSASTYNEKLGIPANACLNGFNGVQDLDTDLQFYSVLDNDKSDSDDVKVQDLYIYSTEGNPGSRFKSIEIGEHKHVISGSANDVVVDNLALKFCGGHGVSMGTVKDRVYTNMIISYIGGSVLSTNFRDSGEPVNFGNAIEVYGGCDGYTVENCWIYQIFDTGVTHQFADNGSCKQQRVRYYGNLIEYCFWSIEIYNSLGDSTQPKAVQFTKDVHISHNVVNKTGYGWGSIGWGAATPEQAKAEGKRYRSGFVYCVSGLAHNEDELTEYNVFNGSSGYVMYLPPNSNEVFDKNIYIQKKGNLLGRLKEYKETYCDYDAANLIFDKLEDTNAVVIVTE